jgi:hypothetical protein
LVLVDSELVLELIAAVEDRIHKLSPEEAYKEGFNEGWDSCNDNLVEPYRTFGAAERAWKNRGR